MNLTFDSISATSVQEAVLRHKSRFAFAVMIGLIGVATAAQATPVPAATNGLTDLGSFGSGTYHVTATGTVSLVDLAANPNSLIFNPDGTLAQITTRPGFTYFNSAPDAFDTPDNSYGVGGTAIYLGSVFGSLTATPASTSDYFAIGSGTTVTLASAGHIYAQVNDIPFGYGDNSGSFALSVSRSSPASVPEPAAIALLGVGLLGLGLTRRASIGNP